MPQRVVSVYAVAVVRAEHHDRREPPAIDRVLHHLALLGRALHHLQQQVVALALVEGFLLAHANHGARIRPVAALAQRDLVHDRGAVHQPADHPDVGPGERRIVEDRAVLGLAREQAFGEFVARHAERFGGGIQVEAVTALVLHLGKQDGLALEARCAGDPVALGQHADDLGVGMLADLADQGLAILLGHPVLGLDEAAGIDPGVELGLVLRVLDLARPFRVAIRNAE